MPRQPPWGPFGGGLPGPEAWKKNREREIENKYIYIYIYIWQFLICLNNRKIYRGGWISEKYIDFFGIFFRSFLHSGAYFDIEILIFGSRASDFSKKIRKTTRFWPFRDRYNLLERNVFSRLSEKSNKWKSWRYICLRNLTLVF